MCVVCVCVCVCVHMHVFVSCCSFACQKECIHKNANMQSDSSTVSDRYTFMQKIFSEAYASLLLNPCCHGKPNIYSETDPRSTINRTPHKHEGHKIIFQNFKIGTCSYLVLFVFCVAHNN